MGYCCISCEVLYLAVSAQSSTASRTTMPIGFIDVYCIQGNVCVGRGASRTCADIPLNLLSPPCCCIVLFGIVLRQSLHHFGIAYVYIHMLHFQRTIPFLFGPCWHILSTSPHMPQECYMPDAAHLACPILHTFAAVCCQACTAHGLLHPQRHPTLTTSTGAQARARVSTLLPSSSRLAPGYAADIYGAPRRLHQADMQLVPAAHCRHAAGAV